MPALVLEQLRLLRALRCRGGDVIAAWEALPLECLLMLLSASPRAQAALQGLGGGHDGILVSHPSPCQCALRLMLEASLLPVCVPCLPAVIGISDVGASWYAHSTS